MNIKKSLLIFFMLIQGLQVNFTSCLSNKEKFIILSLLHAYMLKDKIKADFGPPALKLIEFLNKRKKAVAIVSLSAVALYMTYKKCKGILEEKERNRIAQEENERDWERWRNEAPRRRIAEEKLRAENAARIDELRREEQRLTKQREREQAEREVKKREERELATAIEQSLKDVPQVKPQPAYNPDATLEPNLLPPPTEPPMVIVPTESPPPYNEDEA